jgi:hypothetical protein
MPPFFEVAERTRLPGQLNNGFKIYNKYMEFALKSQQVFHEKPVGIIKSSCIHICMVLSEAVELNIRAGRVHKILQVIIWS